jgi:hypothetical protein
MVGETCEKGIERKERTTLATAKKREEIEEGVFWSGLRRALFWGGIYILEGRRRHFFWISAIKRAAFLHYILRRMSDHFKHPRHQKNQIYLPISLFSGESTLLARSFRFLLAT